jgi:hypothetical protein
MDTPPVAYYGRHVSDPADHSEDLRDYEVDAADGPIGVVSEAGTEHLAVRIRRGMSRHGEVLVPRILIAEVDHESKRIRLSASRAEVQRLGGTEPREGLGAWFGGVSTSAQQPFPPTLPGPEGAPGEGSGDGSGRRR